MSQMLDRMHAACLTAGVPVTALHSHAAEQGLTPLPDLYDQLAALLLHGGDTALRPVLSTLIIRHRQQQTQALIATFSPATFPTQAVTPPAPLPEPRSAQVEARRLDRARLLRVQPVRGGYLVTGGSEPRAVTAGLRCECPDHDRTPLCKHVLAALLLQGRALRADQHVTLPG